MCVYIHIIIHNHNRPIRDCYNMHKSQIPISQFDVFIYVATHMYVHVQCVGELV